jgi:hypothetical protein
MYILIRRQFLAFLFAMQKLSIFFASSLLLLMPIFSPFIGRVFAEDISSVGIATYMPISAEVEDGDIISSTPKGYVLSTKSYDPQVVGIVATKPAIALKMDSEEEGTPVVNIGSTMVKVIGTNGDIKKGDFITTSDKQGIGMKATRSGYIIGQALEDIVFPNKNAIELVGINLNLHFLQLDSSVNDSLTSIFTISQLAAYEEPIRFFKYLMSVLVLILSFGFGFFIFSRAINTGIQALGRNPLAGRAIQLSIIFNVVLVIIIITSAIGIVWMFLRV